MGIKSHENGLHSMWCRLAAIGSSRLRLELVSKHMLHSASAPCEPSSLLALQAAGRQSSSIQIGHICVSNTNKEIIG